MHFSSHWNGRTDETGRREGAIHVEEDDGVLDGSVGQSRDYTACCCHLVVVCGEELESFNGELRGWKRGCFVLDAVGLVNC